MAPERPRLTLALAFVGRWRDAARTLAGLRWILVAGGVLLLLNRTARRALAWPVDALADTNLAKQIGVLAARG